MTGTDIATLWKLADRMLTISEQARKAHQEMLQTLAQAKKTTTPKK